VWFGRIKSASEFAAQHGLSEGAYADEVAEYLRGQGAAQVLVLRGENTDSGDAAPGARFAGQEGFAVEGSLLWPAMAEARVFKSEREIAVLRHVGRATSEAHLAMMGAVRPGMREDQLEAVYKFWVQFAAGARLDSYTWICGSGPNAAVLHYGHAGAPNDRVIRAGEWVLCDCGNELHCYASDVTTTFPASGVFSPEQRVVYEAVLDAQRAVLAAMRPGVRWLDMQELAYRRILEGLKRGGVVVGDVDAALAPEVNLGGVFMPHGLGHLLGLETHDVGGYLPRGVARDPRYGFRSLRTTRVLAPGMVITVEPGCYFADSLLDAAFANPLQAPFLNRERIDAHFRGIGGVRLEDNVVVRPDGIENLTHVPRAVEDVEAACAKRIRSIDDIPAH
jgi:Xaa-Pro dipeptidase